MTPKQEAVIWRKIGTAFERAGDKGKSGVGKIAERGICWAMNRYGLPAYGQPGGRVQPLDGHGPYIDYYYSLDVHLEAAYHRALSAYLMAEMVTDGLAPGGTVET